MLRRSRYGGAAVAVVLAALTGTAAWGADDTAKKKEQAPESAETKSTVADEAQAPRTPEELLKSRGLTRSGSHYILEEREQECFKKFGDIKPLYETLETSFNKLSAIAMSEAQIQELQAEEMMLRQQIQVVGSSGTSSSRYGGRYARYAQSPTQQMQQQLRAQQGMVAQQLAVAKQQAPPAKTKQDQTALYQKHRAELMEKSTEVQELFDKVQKDYTDIEAEPPVRAALGELRKSAKAQLKIAPSAEFTKKLAQLKKLERMMDPQSAAKEAAAKSKGKKKSKAKR